MARQPALLTYPLAIVLSQPMLFVREWLYFGDRPPLIMFVFPIILSVLLGSRSL
ncbi:MAG: hypothetical protein JWN23_2541 [Rhodocyclales bacterium]|nr:hypothetical protein [Rhodocyclales bacterium]